MWSSLVESKPARAVAVVLAIGIFVAWEFGVKSTLAKRQAWEGKVTNVYRQREWLRGFRKPGKAEYLYYDHYWTVACTDGESRAVEVPHTLWQRATVGTPLRKVEGERYPVIDTPEAASRREMNERVLNTLVDEVKRAVTE